MPIYHIAYHGYKRKPSDKEMQERMTMFQVAFSGASFVEEGFVGQYFDPEDGYHDAVCVKFKDIETYRTHMRAPHGPDEATHLRENVARIRAFDAPEHIALHTKIVNAMKSSATAGEPAFPSYAFHATNDPNADIRAIRAELKKVYQQIEKADWVNMPPGSVQIMMLGTHE